MKSKKVLITLVISIILTTTSNIVISDYVGDEETWVADSSCARFGYIQPSAVYGQWIITTQNGTPGRTPPWDPPQFAIYDINNGWITTHTEIFDPNTYEKNSLIHNSWGYCGGYYWNFEGATKGKYMYEVHAENWEDFQTMCYEDERTIICNPGAYNTIPQPYEFNDTYMWLLFSEWTGDYWYPAYVPWNTEDGWGDITLIEEGKQDSSHSIVCVELLRFNKTHWVMYFGIRQTRKVLYMESLDMGETWTSPKETGISSIRQTSSHRLSFARYGHGSYWPTYIYIS